MPAPLRGLRCHEYLRTDDDFRLNENIARTTSPSLPEEVPPEICSVGIFMDFNLAELDVGHFDYLPELVNGNGELVRGGKELRGRKGIEALVGPTSV